MSKLRQNLVENDSDLDTPRVPDGLDYVVFTKKRDDLPHKFAGFINAPDDVLGLAYAREHYGQDEECVSIWLIPTEHIGGRSISFRADSSSRETRPFEVFVQANEGGVHLHQGQVHAASADEALKCAGDTIDGASAGHSVWAIDRATIVATEPDDLIWRHVSQDYRLARGYSRDVREKWERIRAVEDVDRYQAEDLKETF